MRAHVNVAPQTCAPQIFNAALWGILIDLGGRPASWLLLPFRSSQSIQAENLFLRRPATHSPELQALIRRMANENPSWGEERIANELLLKLGIRVSPRTVNKYLPRPPRGRPQGDLRWSTFLRLHARGIIACDFFVATTATFRLMYAFVVIEHGSRRLIHCNVTAHPSAA